MRCTIARTRAPRLARSGAALACAALALAAPATAAEIRALGGTYDEQVTAIREEAGRLVVRTPQRAIPLDAVKSIRFQDVTTAAADRRGARLLLVTGDVLRGTIQGGNDESLSLQTQGLGDVRVALELVCAITLDASIERERELEASLEQQAEIDLVRLKDGGTARGSIVLIDGSKVTLDTDVEGGSHVGKLTFDVAKVEMIAIAPLSAPPAPPTGVRVTARLVDGSALTGKVVGLANDELRIEHKLAGEGQSLSIPTARLAELLVQNGAFVYLSDIEPQVVDQHFPPEYAFEPEVWGWKRDRNVTGGPIKLAGRGFDKGLGVHSYCALTFSAQGYREFKATIGLDDATRYLGEPGFGAVTFKVLLDGKPAKEHPTGVVIRKGGAPVDLVIDVSGAATITLIADFDPTSLHILGRADWADAHLVKR